MKRAALVIVALALIGIIYEQIGERRDRKRYPQIGHSVNIGGRTLNIYCSGEGSPTVIFEGAGHTAGYAWIGMQAEAAKFTRACWYERAGYGWSDSGPSPRTFKAIANDLHSLLRAAAISPPYVLVGATAGAFHVRVYTGLYPREVAGAVLIHADDPDVFAHEPEYMKVRLAGLPPSMQRIGCAVLRPTMLRLGLIAIGESRCGETLRACEFKPGTTTGTDLPFKQSWNQPRLAKLSTRGHLVIEEDAERTDGIVEAIHSVVTEVRTQQ